MNRIIVLTLCAALASFSLTLAGCDTGAGKGSTPPKDKLATPARGPMSGEGGANVGGAGGSTAPQVLPPPPTK